MQIIREIIGVVATATYDTDANTIAIEFTEPREYGALAVRRVVLSGDFADLYGVNTGAGDAATQRVSHILARQTLLVGIDY